MTDERKFLHDLSTPLAAVFLLVYSIEESIKKSLSQDAEQVDQLEMALAGLKKIQTLIENRRELLVTRDKK